MLQLLMKEPQEYMKYFDKIRGSELPFLTLREEKK